MSPRYYLADETDGEGDGTYEFRPLKMESLLYSDVDKVEVREGEHSGEFLITFDEVDDKNHHPINGSAANADTK